MARCDNLLLRITCIINISSYFDDDLWTCNTFFWQRIHRKRFRSQHQLLHNDPEAINIPFLTDRVDDFVARQSFRAQMFRRLPHLCHQVVWLTLCRPHLREGQLKEGCEPVVAHFQHEPWVDITAHGGQSAMHVQNGFVQVGNRLHAVTHQGETHRPLQLRIGIGNQILRKLECKGSKSAPTFSQISQLH